MPYIPAHANGCWGCQRHGLVPPEPYLDVHEASEWPGEEVAALSFHRGGEPIATLEVGEAPRVEIEGPERREGSLLVRVRTGRTHTKRRSWCCSAATMA